MKAAVAYEAGKPLVFEDVPIPEIGPRDVLVRVAARSICHTDLVVIDQLSPDRNPVVPGHEACGEVEAVGADVRRVRVGDRVLASVLPACASCWWCLNGMSHQCERGGQVGSVPRVALPDGRSATATGGCGAFAEAMVVDEASLLAVDTTLPDIELALLGCGVTTGLGAALNTAGVTPGASVVVIGCGGVGQSVVQGARIAGATTIIAVDLSAERRAASLQVGATHTVDPAHGSAVDQVRSLTGGRGADFSFDIVGLPSVTLQAYDMARKEGTVTLVGLPPGSAELTLSSIDLLASGRRLVGCVFGGAQILRDLPRYIRMAETGQLDLSSLVTSTLRLDQVNEGLELSARADGVRTVLV